MGWELGGCLTAFSGKGAGRPRRKGNERGILRRGLLFGGISRPAGREQGRRPCSPWPFVKAGETFVCASRQPLIHIYIETLLTFYICYPM